MYVITNEKLLSAVSGGLDDVDTNYFTDSSDSENMAASDDQRNEQQKQADQKLKDAQQACKFLQNNCAQYAALTDFYIQTQAYDICMATTGVGGPSGCGARPTLKK